MNLKNYQANAVEEIMRRAEQILESENKRVKTIVLDSVMGSGKTIIASSIINRLNSEIGDCVFIWVTPGKGNLHTQSAEKLANLIYTGSCSLIDDIYRRSLIDAGSVIVSNYEKLNRENNKFNQSGDYASFEEIMRNTRQKNKIILLVDESHYAFDSEKAIWIKEEEIRPDLLIEMSATPRIRDPRQCYYISVPVDDVIDEGMIKKEGVINLGIKNIDNLNDKDGIQVIIEATIHQHSMIAKAYQHHGANINPLALIQIPDAEKGSELRSYIEEILGKAGFTTKNGTVSVWLSDDNINTEDISSNTSKVKFLLFKHTVAMGWDCPRAHILAVFRESSNKSFRVQTLGRIYRTAERKHYDDPILDCAYMFTNLAGAKNSLEEDAFVTSPNKIKDLHTYVKPEFKSLQLMSFYKEKSARRPISSKFVEDEYLKPPFEKNTGVEFSKNVEENLNNLLKNGFNFSLISTDEVMTNTKLPMKDIMDKAKIEAEETLNLNLSDRIIQFKFEKLIKNNLNGFPAAKSLDNIGKAIYKFFFKYLGKTDEDIIDIQKVIIQNSDLFGEILNQATKNFKEYQIKEKGEYKDRKSGDYIWIIPEEDSFSSNTYEKVNYLNYMMTDCYLLKAEGPKKPKTETNFEEKFLAKNEHILGWYKNGDHAIKYFAVRYFDKDGKEKPFYVDYIIVFKNGAIGLFDTKSGWTAKNDEAGPKSDGLQEYIEKYSTEEHPLIGGIVVEKNGVFKVFCGRPYDENDSNKWIPIEGIIKK